ncbi:helix-turn-helix transcriptional regulator [Aurantibacillus circumpalustris]|uniref:helix-turn-helix transcriptional regulator n=1 Tax=Aurantibacillus circumpalustris TaxID=3036359 RepID=UPI00295C186C|nr:YafY family protein [Aurantibacillus circumpalustris]
MNRIDRLFGILTLLQSKKYVQAETIASKFNISIRTVYRDIKALCEQGVPVSFEQTKGYFIVNGYFLPPISFNSDEANALLLIESIVYGFSDKSIKKNYSSALNKIKAVLNKTQKDKLEALNNTTHLQLPSRITPDLDYLSTLQNAISSKQIIEIDYTNSKELTTKRSLEPIGLVFYALSWHLIAWCHLRSEYRDFKISRIKAIKNTSIPFTRTAHIELSEYIKQLPVSF